MSQSGVQVAADCIDTFNALKGAKKFKYVIFKISDNLKEIVIDKTGTDTDWEVFFKDIAEGSALEPRYATYDFDYSLGAGEGERSKILFISWSPDDAKVKPKMVYASSKEALKRTLGASFVEIQANDKDDLEYDTILKQASKGGAR